MPDPSIANHLTKEDDPDFWYLATSTILAEAARTVQFHQDEVFAQVGCCRHWIRPHQMRWNAGGGFAWPAGYDKTTTGYSFSALPALDWSEFFRWTGIAWEPGRTGRRCLLLRVAIPARTARHRQAANHTVWTPHDPDGKKKVVQLFGFRKAEAGWSCTATEVLRPRK